MENDLYSNGTHVVTLGLPLRLADGAGHFNTPFFYWDNGNSITLASGQGTYVYNKNSCTLQLYAPTTSPTSFNQGIGDISITIKQSTTGNATDSIPISTNNAQCQTTSFHNKNEAIIKATKQDSNGTFTILYDLKADQKLETFPTFKSNMTNSTFIVFTESSYGIPNRIGTEQKILKFNGFSNSTQTITGQVKNGYISYIAGNKTFTEDFAKSAGNLQKTVLLSNRGTNELYNNFISSDKISQGQSFSIDPTYGYVTGTTYEALGLQSQNACPFSSLGSASAVTFLTGSGNTCNVFAQRFDLTSLGNQGGITIGAATYRYNVTSATGANLNCNFVGVQDDPKTANYTTLGHDVVTGTVYVSNTATCATSGGFKTNSLNNAGVLAIQNAINTGSSWFAIGNIYTNWGDTGANRNTVFTANSEQLTFTYTTYSSQSASPPGNSYAQNGKTQNTIYWTTPISPAAVNNYLIYSTTGNPFVQNNLPDNGKTDDTTIAHAVNMTGNTLLLHADHWDNALYLSGNNDIIDRSGYGNNGTWVGSSSFGNGYFAGTKAMNFTGSNYVSIGNINLLNFEYNNPFTFSTWIKDNSTSSERLISKYDGTRGYIFSVFQQSGKDTIQLEMYVSGGGFIENSNLLIVRNGQWHNIVLTYDGSCLAQGVNIYLDGIKQVQDIVSNTGCPATLKNNQDVEIGARTGGIEKFTGRMADVIIKPRLVTAAEVAAMYNSNAANPTYQIRDHSGNNLLIGGNNPSTVSNAISLTNSILGGGIQFGNKTNYLQYTNSKFPLQQLNPWTIDFWWKPQDTVNFNAFVFNKTVSTTSFLRVNTTYISLFTDSSNPIFQLAQPSNPTGKWQNIGVTRTGNVFSVYTNGTLLSSVTDNVNLGIPTSNSIDIGTTSSKVCPCFMGTIDEFFTMNRTMTATEINNVEQRGVGNYNFLASTSSTTYTDTGLPNNQTKYYKVLAQTGSSYNGTLTNYIPAKSFGIPNVDQSLTATRSNSTNANIQFFSPTNTGGTWIGAHYLQRQNGTDTTYYDQPFIPNLLSIWHLDGNTNYANYGKYSDTLTVSGNTKFVTGKIFNAFNLDGATFLTAQNQAHYSFEFNTPFAISLWEKNSISGANDVFVSKVTTLSSSPGYVLYQNSLDNKIHFDLIDSTLTVHDVASSITANDGNWHHILAVWTTTQLLIYEDGALEGTTNTSFTTSIQNSNSLIIGALAGGGSFCTCVVDDVRIYGQTVTSTQDAQLFNYSPIQDPYVANYPFDGTLHDIIGGNEGFLNGGSPQLNFTTGKYNQALAFNGNMYINASGTNLPTGNHNRSVAFWVYPTQFTDNTRLFNWGTTSSQSDFVAAENGTSGKITVNTIGSSLTSTGTLTKNQWNHVAITLNGTSLKIYIGGTFDSSLTTGTVNTASTKLFIGSDATTPGTLLIPSGTLLDNIHIYNIALSQTQIQSDMNNNIPSIPITFSDNTISGGGNFNYRVYPMNQIGGGAFSSVSGTIGAVTNLHATAISTTEVDLAWSTPSLGTQILSGYQINYTTPWGTPNTILVNNTSNGLTTYNVLNLVGNTQYSFRIGTWTTAGLNPAGNILNVQTSAGFQPINYTSTSLNVTGANPNVNQITFTLNPINTTSSNLVVSYPATMNMSCNFGFVTEQTNKTYFPLARGTIGNSMVASTFQFNNASNDVTNIICTDVKTNASGRYVISNTPTQGFELLTLIKNFKNGTYGTYGIFGAFDFVGLAAVILSMIGLNRTNEAAGIIFSIIFLGMMAYFQIITIPGIILGAIALVILVAIISTRKVPWSE